MKYFKKLYHWWRHRAINIETPLKTMCVKNITNSYIEFEWFDGEFQTVKFAHGNDTDYLIVGDTVQMQTYKYLENLQPKLKPVNQDYRNEYAIILLAVAVLLIRFCYLCSTGGVLQNYF